MKLRTVEVVFLDEHQGWETKRVDIPEEIVNTQSQDAFIKWAYGTTTEAQDFVSAHDFIAVFVMTWSDPFEEG